MKPLLLILGIFFLLIACQTNEEKESRAAAPPTSSDSSLIEAPAEPLLSDFPIPLQADSLPYSQILQQIAAQRQQLAQSYTNKQIDLDSVGRSLEAILVKQIMPYWYGTPWSFEGHTNQPKQGEIACGYLVSTSLQHIGMQLNRYKLAQQYPELEARSLAVDSSFYWQTDYEGLYKQPEGLYFVGLGSSHVGFLWKKYKNLFFIHANYTSSKGVMIEFANQSEVLAGYENYHIAAITANPQLLKSWLYLHQIPIQTTF